MSVQNYSFVNSQDPGTQQVPSQLPWFCQCAVCLPQNLEWQRQLLQLQRKQRELLRQSFQQYQQHHLQTSISSYNGNAGFLPPSTVQYQQLQQDNSNTLHNSQVSTMMPPQLSQPMHLFDVANGGPVLQNNTYINTGPAPIRPSLDHGSSNHPNPFVSLQEVELRPQAEQLDSANTEFIVIEDDAESVPHYNPLVPYAPSSRSFKKQRTEYEWLPGHDVPFERSIRQNTHNIQVNDIKNAATARARQIDNGRNKLNSSKVSKKTNPDKCSSQRKSYTQTARSASKKAQKSESPVGAKSSKEATNNHDNECAQTKLHISETTSKVVGGEDKENNIPDWEIAEYEALFDAGSED